MPKFLTYQRPAAVDRRSPPGRPGAVYGKPGKRAPKPAPDARNPVLDIRLPGLTPPRQR